MVTKQRADALQDALNEIEAIRDRISHPRGRRASFIDSMDQQRVDALNEAWDAINGLIEASIEQRAACPPPGPSPDTNHNQPFNRVHRALPELKGYFP